MTLMQLVGLLKAAINEDQPADVLREIAIMIEVKIKEGISNHEHMHLADFLQVLKQQGITNSGFAAKAGISPSHLSQILKGKKPNLSMQTMLQIVKASGGAVNRVEDFAAHE